MSFQEMLDIILALVLIYFILSMVSSALSQLLMESMEIRGRTLTKYLHVIAGEKTADLLDLPQIKSLRPIRFRSWLGIFGASTEPKMVENIPIPILTDSFLELMGLAGKEDQGVEVLQKIVDDMPESEGKRAIQLWIAQGVTHLDDLKAKLGVFFSGLLEQAAATANANARSFVIGLSILLVCALGTDTITIARDIWYAPALRAAFIAGAENLVLEDSNCDMPDLARVADELDSLSVGIGWPQALRYLPVNAGILGWAGFLALKVVGLAITIIFVSQGSGFWFDLLNKLK